MLQTVGNPDYKSWSSITWTII